MIKEVNEVIQTSASPLSPIRHQKEEMATSHKSVSSPYRTSPTAHLGKRPRSYASPPAGSPLRKIPKLSSIGDAPGETSRHDIDAWQQPTFMHVAEKQVEVTEEASSGGKIKHDAPPRDLVLPTSTAELNETEPKASHSVPDLLNIGNAVASSSRDAGAEEEKDD